MIKRWFPVSINSETYLIAPSTLFTVFKCNNLLKTFHFMIIVKKEQETFFYKLLKGLSSLNSVT